MKHCLIITAYKNVEMLRCLLKATHEYCLCYVHVDKKRWNEFVFLEREFPDVVFLHNLKINWGGIEHLEIILDMMKMSLEKEYSFVHIISGEDYPIKPMKDIIEEFEGNDKIYCDFECVSKKHFAYKRFCFYWLYTKFSMNYKKKIVRYLNLFCVCMQKILPIRKRNHIGKINDVYWGFVWGTYPKYAIEYILDYIKSNGEFWSDLITCKIPEELCFQTILMNSQYKDKIINNNLRYWTFEGGDNSGPVYLNDNDIFNKKFNEAIFCRKVKYDSNVRKILEERQ